MYSNFFADLSKNTEKPTIPPMKKKISRESLFKYIKKRSSSVICDSRRPQACTYSFPKAVMTAFSAFYLQQPSFLRHEENLQKPKFRRSIQKLFLEDPITIMQTVRNILDPVPLTFLHGVFDDIFAAMDRSGLLREFKVDNEIGLLLAFDGITYFSSGRLTNVQCSVTKHQDGHETYTQAGVTLSLIHPTLNISLPIAFEPIVPQDGHEKQDCERAAMHRLLKRFRAKHKTIQGTLLVDALHANHPAFVLLEELRLHWLAACKPGSQKTLYEWVDTARMGKDLGELYERIRIDGVFYKRNYEYMNDIPIRDSKDAVRTNFISLTEVNERTDVRRKFDYTTDLKIDQKNVIKSALAGRRRWKIENEEHNTLTNQGYSFKHNYGHGKQYLLSMLAMLKILAFLIHELLCLVGQDGLSQLMHEASRQECFENIRVSIKGRQWKSWEELYLHILSWNTS